MDAYQAPSKTNHYYYFGIELLICPVSFAINNGMFFINKTWTINTIICAMVLLYLCKFTPFRQNATEILYTSYIINLGCQVMLVSFYYEDAASTSYAILYKIVIIIAQAEFGCTILYYLYISHLYKTV